VTAQCEQRLVALGGSLGPNSCPVPLDNTRACCCRHPLNGNVLSWRVTMSVALLLGASAVGLEVLETRWGFDGKALPGHFALLSVLVRNPASFPYDGEVAVCRDDGMDQRRGGFLVQRAYVSAGECRWLQFYPYVSSMGSSQPWQLGWGRRFRRRIAVGAPPFGVQGFVAGNPRITFFAIVAHGYPSSLL